MTNNRTNRQQQDYGQGPDQSTWSNGQDYGQYGSGNQGGYGNQGNFGGQAGYGGGPGGYGGNYGYGGGQNYGPNSYGGSSGYGQGTNFGGQAGYGGFGSGQYSGQGYGNSGYGGSQSGGFGGATSGSQGGYGGSGMGGQGSGGQGYYVIDVWTLTPEQHAQHAQNHAQQAQQHAQQAQHHAQMARQKTSGQPGGENLSDDQIQQEVNDALDRNSTTSNEDIQATVNNKVVTLSGTVRSRDTKKTAESVAENCPGVKDVQNNIQIKGRNDDSGQIQKETRRSTAAAGSK